MDVHYYFYGLCFVVFGLLVYTLGWKSSQKKNKQIYKKFGVDPKKYRITGTDIGKNNNPKKLEGTYKDTKIAGNPDVVFEPWPHCFYLPTIIGEYKSRFSRNEVLNYELFQVILYMKFFNRSNIKGIILYGDGKTYNIKFDPKLAKKIIELASDAYLAKKRKHTYCKGLIFNQESIASLISD